ncbi:hypothetical protein KPATCC21470_5509 [Kitasatospora purpeofusca]
MQRMTVGSATDRGASLLTRARQGSPGPGRHGVDRTVPVRSITLRVR